MTHEGNRIGWGEYEQHAPDTIAALRALGKAVESSGLDAMLTELVKVRASQVNGCAFCLNLHLSLARKAGVAQTKLDLLPTWREVAIFSERERAALDWTESLTLMAQRPVADGSYAELERHFSAAEIANLTAAIALINAWNRIAGGLRFSVPVSAK